MKVAIYQFWDGNVRESALAGVKNMKSYAKKIGADYKFENNPNWLKRDLKIDFGGYSAHFGAFKPVFNSEWDSYDKILFADTDVFTIENLEENIFDHFHGEIGICEESFQPKQRLITAGRITSKLDEKWAKLLEKNYGVKVPRTKENLVRVFNSGVVLYSKEGRIKAQKEFEKFDKYVSMIRSSGLHSFYASDQPFLHAMMFAKKFNVQEMDDGWNSYVHGTADIWQPKRRIVDHRTEKTKFVHCQFPGADNMNEEQLLKIVNLSRDKWDYDI